MEIQLRKFNMSEIKDEIEKQSKEEVDDDSD